MTPAIGSSPPRRLWTAPPSGFGAMPRCLGGGVPTITSLSSSGAQRFSGAATITVYGSGFTPFSYCLIASVPQSTIFVSSTQLTVNIDQNTAWTVGAKVVQVADGAYLSNSDNYTITEHPSLWGEWDPADASNTIVSGAYSVLAELSGTGQDASQGTAANRPIQVASAMNGRTAARYDNGAMALDTPADGSVNGVGSSGSHWFRATQVAGASLADDVNMGWMVLVPGGNEYSRLGSALGGVAGETWGASRGVGAATQGGTAGLTYSSGENYVEEVETASGGNTTLRKNGTGISLTLGTTTGDYSPNGGGAGGSTVLRLRGSRLPTTVSSYWGRSLVFSANLSTAVALQVRRYLGSLYAVTVT